MTNHLSFLRAIAANPGDDSYRLVFADWLEEQGDGRAEFLRLDCRLQALPAGQSRPADLQERWMELRALLSPSWLAILGRSSIENCEHRFLFRCPERWDHLAPTDEAATRFCQACQERVYHCDTLEEARKVAREGHCVAIDEGLARSPGDLLSGPPTEQIVTMGLFDDHLS
jgi:uncharacterized protein (TIGR02996 family)